MYYASNAYISAKIGSSVLVKACFYMDYYTDGKAIAESLMAVLDKARYETGKWQNRELFLFLFFLSS